MSTSIHSAHICLAVISMGKKKRWSNAPLGPPGSGKPSSLRPPDQVVTQKECVWGCLLWYFAPTFKRIRKFIRTREMRHRVLAQVWPWLRFKSTGGGVSKREGHGLALPITVWTWPAYLTFLVLSCFICRMGAVSTHSVRIKPEHAHWGALLLIVFLI